MIAKRQKQTPAEGKIFSLDPYVKCERAQEFEEKLSARKRQLGFCRIRKSLFHDSKEIANASVFAEPLTLSAFPVNETRRTIVAS
jgi:hypothetical protein